jgi:galactofuranosylgalactofuranosylrhamnosyl-N-acetylglucosaminyl-diphospho-decaprenol beta-1,5/1,6-galactofuranosyltransferase
VGVSANQSEAVLQAVVFTDDVGLSPLFAKKWRNGWPAAPTASNSRRVVTLEAGEVLSTDTYLNAFFESCWRRLATPTHWTLRLRVRGEARLRLFRVTASGRAGIGAPIPVGDRTGEMALNVEPAKPGDPESRLAFELEAATEGAVLEEAAWTVRSATTRPVRLVVGLCCFNRDDLVLGTVRQLLNEPAVWRDLVRLVLVDQSGKGQLRAEVGRLAGADGRVVVVEQGNFGGTGGFTRIILEALDEPDATHVLLMDDDVAIEPECVRRTTALLSVAEGELAIGGQMLDLGRPTTMHEAGATLLRERWQVRAELRGEDLTSAATVDRLMRPLAVDYLGWFFCAMPLSAIRRVGLPLPFFINFDDVEFGLRLAQAHVRLATVPGIALWHQTGPGKETRWRSYYYQLNTLIINARYRLSSPAEAAALFRKRWLRALRKRDVVRPALAARAVTDFLAGPATISGDPCVPADQIRAFCASASRRCNNPLRLFATWRTIRGAAMALERAGAVADSSWRQKASAYTSPNWWRVYLRTPAAHTHQRLHSPLPRVGEGS